MVLQKELGLTLSGAHTQKTAEEPSIKKTESCHKRYPTSKDIKNEQKQDGRKGAFAI